MIYSRKPGTIIPEMKQAHSRGTARRSRSELTELGHNITVKSPDIVNDDINRVNSVVGGLRILMEHRGIKGHSIESLMM